MMQRRVEQLVMEPIDDFFHYGTRGLGEALTPWRMPEWTGRKEWGERSGSDGDPQSSLFRRHLSKGNRSSPGDRFSLPDITLYAFLLFTDILSFPVPPELKGLAAWRARVEALPAVRNRGGKDILPKTSQDFAA